MAEFFPREVVMVLLRCCKMHLMAGIRSMLCRIFYLHVNERHGEMRIVVERDSGEQGERHRDAGRQEGLTT